MFKQASQHDPARQRDMMWLRAAIVWHASWPACPAPAAHQLASAAPLNGTLLPRRRGAARGLPRLRFGCAMQFSQHQRLSARVAHATTRQRSSQCEHHCAHAPVTVQLLPRALQWRAITARAAEKASLEPYITPWRTRPGPAVQALHRCVGPATCHLAMALAPGNASPARRWDGPQRRHPQPRGPSSTAAVAATHRESHQQCTGAAATA